MSLLDFLFGRKQKPEDPMLAAPPWRGEPRPKGREPDDSVESDPVEEAYAEYERLRRKRRWLLISLGITVFLILVITVYYYNRLTTLQQAVFMTRADIESCLQMRENLVPVLFISVADFVKHEDDIFLHAADARARSIGTKTDSSSQSDKGKPPDKPKDGFSAFLSKLFAVAERYPDLKTSPSFQILMTQVAEAEKGILDQRIDYNDAAYKLNRALRRFPGNVYGVVFGISEVNYFEWKEEPEWVSTLKQD